MKAQVGDYIKFIGYADGATVPEEAMTSKVIDVFENCGEELYTTANGHEVSETELGIDDVLLASEVEIG